MQKMRKNSLKMRVFFFKENSKKCRKNAVSAKNAKVMRTLMQSYIHPSVEF
jgi:hypothetical protein